MKRASQTAFDKELEDVPESLRRQIWIQRVEALIFASIKPVTAETLATAIGSKVPLQPIIEELRSQLKGHAFDIVAVSGGFQFQTRADHGDVLRAVLLGTPPTFTLSDRDHMILTAIAYFQPITRKEISSILGFEISRDAMARLRGPKLIAPGPRSPEPGAPMSYITGTEFLSFLHLNSLDDLPKIDEVDLLAPLREPTEIAETLDSLMGIDAPAEE